MSSMDRLAQVTQEFVPAGTCWNTEDAMALRGLMHIYRTNGSIPCRDAVLDALRHQQPASGLDGMSMGMALMFAREVTGQDSYDEPIRTLAAEGWPQVHTAEEAYHVLPFRMAYEMKLNKMARVHDVAQAFRQLHGELAQKDGLYLLALAETIEACDQQLYEHWRCLVDLYRETLRTLVAQGACQDCDMAIEKGIALGIIDEERYRPMLKGGAC